MTFFGQKAGGVLAAIGFTLGAALPGAARADTTPFTIGTANTTYSLPFADAGNANPSTRYQQLYNASLFAGPVTITSLYFSIFSADANPAQFRPGTFTFSLSTYGGAMNSLNTSDFNANLGANNQTLFSGTLIPHYDGTGLLFGVTPFTYDPGQGNLLFDIQVSDPGQVSASTNFLAENGSTSFARVSDYWAAGDAAQNYNGGLVTTFNLPVPEPTTWLMLIIGFGAVGVAQRRECRRGPSVAA